MRKRWVCQFLQLDVCNSPSQLVLLWEAERRCRTETAAFSRMLLLTPCSSKNEDMKLLRGTSLVRWQHHYFYDGIVRENSFLGVRILAISIHKLMMLIVGSYSDLSPRWRSWIALDANCGRIVWRWASAEHTAFAKWRIFGNYSHNCFALQCLLLIIG